MNKIIGLITIVLVTGLLSIGWSSLTVDTSVEKNVTPDSTLTTNPAFYQDVVSPANETCRMCNKRESTGACKNASQCRGSYSDCKSKGCKDTGSSSCSSSANVKKC